MKLIVTRHGETEYNLQERFAGSTDVPINEMGIKQAEELRERLAGTSIDVIVTSPLQRARMTTEIIQKDFPDVPVIINEHFAERCVGVFEGMTKKEIKEQYPEVWEKVRNRPSDIAPPEAETIREFDERVGKGLQQVLEEYSGQTVLLVCHGFVSTVVNRRMTGLSLDDMHHFLLGNCQVQEYEFQQK